MSDRYSGIDVMTCVQGNTARVADLYSASGSVVEGDRCKVYDFNKVYDYNKVYDFKREAASSCRARARSTARRDHQKGSFDHNAAGKPGRSRNASRSISRRKAARARARRVRVLRTALFLFLVMTTMFGISGIASRAKSREVPAAYKYYDTITVGYQENLLDIVERYDDRDHYETQIDYVEELCRINNIEFDGTAYPSVTPGTHLVVPYYSAELK